MMVAVCLRLADRNPASAGTCCLMSGSLSVFESQSERLPVDRTGRLSRPMSLRTSKLADVTTFGSVYPRTRSR